MDFKTLYDCSGVAACEIRQSSQLDTAGVLDHGIWQRNVKIFSGVEIETMHSPNEPFHSGASNTQYARNKYIYRSTLHILIELRATFALLRNFQKLFPHLFLQSIVWV